MPAGIRRRRGKAERRPRRKRASKADLDAAILAELAEGEGDWRVEASFPLDGTLSAALEDPYWLEVSRALTKAAGSFSDDAGAGPFGPGARVKPRRDMGWIRKRERDAKAVARRLLEASRKIKGFAIKAMRFEADDEGGFAWVDVADGRAAVGRWARG